MNSKEFAVVRSGSSGTKEGSSASLSWWFLYKLLIFIVMKSCDANTGLNEHT